MNIQQEQLINQPVNLEAMSDHLIVKLRDDCDREIDKRHREEVKKFKAETKRKAEKYGLVIKVQAKK